MAAPDCVEALFVLGIAGEDRAERGAMLVDTAIAGLTDPFRIGLLIALFATMLRTRPATGTLVPLAAGALFVAIIIPATMGGMTALADMLPLVAGGLLANVVILAAVALLWSVWLRLRG